MASETSGGKRTSRQYETDAPKPEWDVGLRQFLDSFALETRGGEWNSVEHWLTFVVQACVGSALALLWHWAWILVV